MGGRDPAPELLPAASQHGISRKLVLAEPRHSNKGACVLTGALTDRQVHATFLLWGTCLLDNTRSPNKTRCGLF